MPCASTLYFRMAKFGRDRMPHSGSDRPDEAGLKLIEQWIASLGRAALPTEPVPQQLPADLKSAQVIARKLGRGEMSAAERERLLAAAAKLPSGLGARAIRGIFAHGREGTRKLGSNPRPRTILALAGDSARGEKLFWSPTANCGSCHKIGDRGTPIGPDLSSIGKLRRRDDLLESILEPSRRIEPKFVAYTAHTTDGRSLTGLLVKRDEHEIVLRDAQNKEIVLAAKLMEELRPSRTSLMPEGQLAGLTAQEAADLLEYLATRR